MKPKQLPSVAALTVWEVLAVLVALWFLAMLFLPRVGGSEKSPRTQCTSTMKQAALGFILWVNDSEKQHLPYHVQFEDGGIKNPGTNQINIRGVGPFDPAQRSNVWLQFAFVNREIEDPRVLVCPADKKRKIATTWSTNLDGLANPKMQNNAVSYCLGLDAGMTTNGVLSWELSQNHVLLTERHMEYDAVNTGCAADVGAAQFVQNAGKPGRNTPAHVGWKETNPKLHSKGGNVALLDGSTHQVSQYRLNELLDQGDDNGGLHFLYP